MSTQQAVAVEQAAGPAPSQVGRDNNPARLVRRRSNRTRLELLVLLGPAVAMFVTFVIFPVVMAGYFGFFRWNGFGPVTDFVGLRNYRIILTDPTFLSALKHNIFIVVLSLVLQGPIAILLALLMNRKMAGQTTIRVLIFVPYVISEAIVGIGWSLILSTNGALNSFFANLGWDNFVRDWLANPKYAIWSLMLILTWKYIGFAVILFLAGLQGIPVELYEAAEIDGASFWQIQRRITLPLLAPTIRIWAFLSIIGSLQLFDLIYIIWGQYIADTAGVSTMAWYMALNGRLSGNYGYGNAVAVVMFLFSLAIALLYQKFVLSRDTDGAITGPPKSGRKKTNEDDA